MKSIKNFTIKVNKKLSWHKKNRQENKCLMIILLLLFSFIISLINQDSFFFENSEKSIDNIDLENDILKLSGIIKKIHIDDNWSDAKIAGLCKGSGTFNDPYVIEDFKIDGENAGSCILIENSFDFFRIENCTTYNTKYIYDIYQNGIKLYNVANGNITKNYCTVYNKYGIYVENSFNLTISGNTFENNDACGIYIKNSNNSLIFDNVVNNNGGGGIKTENSHNNTISENTIYSNGIVFIDGSRSYTHGMDGIILSNSDFNNISNNIIKFNTGDGIFTDGTDNKITRNSLEKNNGNGIYVIGNNNNITNNYAEKNEYGIYIAGFYNSVFNNSMFLCGLIVSGNIADMGTHIIASTNLINGKPLYFYINEKNLGTNDFTNAGQVILVNCTNSKIENLNVSNGSTGISIYSSNNLIISNNIASNNLRYGIFVTSNCDNLTIDENYVNYNDGFGIFISQITNSTISGNYATKNLYGIYVESGNNNKILQNNAKNNYIGIFLSYCFYNNISENNNSDNWQLYQGMGEPSYFRGYGILLENCYYNLISKNTINNNSDYGIFIEGFNNTLFDNEMNLCGLGLGGSVDDLSSHNISTSNLINGKPLYYYVDEVGLNTTHFNNPGQIILINCSYSSIFNYNIANSSCAIFLSHCNNTLISNNTLSFNSEYGLNLEFCYNVNITENNLYKNVKYGVLIQNCNYSAIEENNANNNDLYGIYLEQCFYNNIIGNVINQNFFGIYFENCGFNNIYCNIINNNTNYFQSLEETSAYYFGYGIILDRSNNNIFNNNTIVRNYNGITILNSQFNHFIGNNISFSKKYPFSSYSSEGSGRGITLYSGNNNEIKGNFLEYNIGSGILLEDLSSSCKNTIIIDNYLKNCGIQIPENPININTITINSSNHINDKLFYLYYNETALTSKNFTNAGQVVLAYCNNSVISKLNVSYGTGGIALYDCNNIKVKNNTASFNSAYGIYIGQDCNNITISNNTVNRNNIKFTQSSYGSGIVSIGNNINITNNKINFNNFSGIMIFGKNQTILNNTLDGCGLFFEPMYRTFEELELINIDTSNKVNGKPIYYYASKSGLKPNNFTNAGQIILANCSNSLITGVNISDVFFGIISMLCNNITISENIISDNKYMGIYYYGYNNRIIGNDFNNNIGYGIWGGGSNNEFIGNFFKNNSKPLASSSYGGNGLYFFGNNNNFSNNIISNNYDGFYLSGSYNTVSNNSIINNRRRGLQVEGYRNIITLNFISENKEVGVMCGGGGNMDDYFFCQSNAVYYNNFTNNNIDAQDNGFNNQWDDGFAGNYWSDYTGSDIDPEDGIGDKMQPISGMAETCDQKPLLYSFYKDYDGDGLNNYEEYTLGKDQYRTNVINPDSDFDGLSDFWEWRNSTNPWSNDSDYDLMPDFWEVMNFLNPIGNDALGDVDNDLLLNLYEYLNGTNPHNNDTDFDKMPDGWEVFNGLNATYDIDNMTDPDNDILLNLYEYLNGTDPHNNDTDFDNMPDGWEVSNGLNATYGIDNMTDPDNDLLLNLYEYLNSTDPHNNDTDDDTFLDGIEASALYDWRTDPLDHWWYPMPNLDVLSFEATTTEIGKPFVLNFTITNNGIWDAENVVIIIWIEYLGITLYNNTNNPIDLAVDEIYPKLIQSEQVSTGGGLLMELILDPDNLINETYSIKNGDIRVDSEGDNSLPTTLVITGELPRDGGLGLEWIILIIIGTIAITGTISALVILRPRIKRKFAFKRQIESAKREFENFETNIRSFIKTKLKDTYEAIWWEAGIPEYIRKTIGPKIKTLEEKKPQIQIDPMDILDFTHYSAIITDSDNWEQIFSKTFPDKGVVETNFENLRIVKRDLNEGTITRENLFNYPLYIHTIRNYFTKGFNVFISYATLDTEYFNVKEVAKRLEIYPQINRVFFWEEDSGENIVTYMERTLAMTKVFVFFCTENSIRSKAVEDEWQAAFQMRKKGLMKIIPVYENEDLIPFLLTPLLNVKFTNDDFDGFIQKLYEEILR